MKKDKNIHPKANIRAVAGQPEDAMEMINKYGTYNIQPTNDSGNRYPAIAQKDGPAGPQKKK